MSARIFAFIPISPKRWPAHEYNVQSKPDSLFHHQKASAVKDKINYSSNGVPLFDAASTSEFGCFKKL
jgi:hypothetical protein